MILIFSNNQEETTNEVIKWLIYLDKKFIRINESEIFEIEIKSRKIFLKSPRNSFFIDDITSVWYRRGSLNFKRLTFKNSVINLHMQEVQYWLEDYVHKTLESKRHINKQSKGSVNKLIVLEKAKDCGLSVPKYFLSDVTDNVTLHKTITKTFSQNMFLENIFKNVDGIGYTAIVREKVNYQFYPTFFQEKIEKDFEIRCFYLAGKTWSIAIISQNDEQTKTDFRKYNSVKPNKNVRYNLPKQIELYLKDQGYDINKLINLTKNDFRISIIVHSSINCMDDKENRIFIVQQKLNENGVEIYSPNLFISNIPFFCEANLFNIGLNRKISIDFDGSIKNYISHKITFGNIKNTSLDKVLESEEFQKKWHISNDIIEKCKDCQYRYSCLSNSDVEKTMT